MRCWSLGAVKFKNLFCSRSPLTRTWWDVLPWCGHIALELWLEPRLALHARPSSAVEEFLSASASLLKKGTSSACDESLTQWAGVVSFLKTIIPTSSVMVLPCTDGAEEAQQQRLCHGMCHEPCSASVPTTGTGSAQPRTHCLIRDPPSMSAATKISV